MIWGASAAVRRVEAVRDVKSDGSRREIAEAIEAERPERQQQNAAAYMTPSERGRAACCSGQDRARRNARGRPIAAGRTAALRRSDPAKVLKAAWAFLSRTSTSFCSKESWMAGTGPATRLGYTDASEVVASAPPASRTVPVLAAAAPHQDRRDAA